MSDSDRKTKHSSIADIAKNVIAGIIMLICTTLYNLFLAHIWPVTIHFGEYSFNNFLFILIAVISSIFLAWIVLVLEIFYIYSSLSRWLSNLFVPKDKRKARKRQWHEHILAAFLLSALTVAGLLLQLLTAKLMKETDKVDQAPPSEYMKSVLESLGIKTDSIRPSEPIPEHHQEQQQ